MHGYGLAPSDRTSRGRHPDAQPGTIYAPVRLQQGKWIDAEWAPQTTTARRNSNRITARPASAGIGDRELATHVGCRPSHPHRPRRSRLAMSPSVDRLWPDSAPCLRSPRSTPTLTRSSPAPRTATADNIRAGMTPEEARRQARIALGCVEQTRGIAREARGLPWLEDSARDVRFATRSLRRSPGFSIATIVILPWHRRSDRNVQHAIHGDDPATALSRSEPPGLVAPPTVGTSIPWSQGPTTWTTVPKPFLLRLERTCFPHGSDGNSDQSAERIRVWLSAQDCFSLGVIWLWPSLHS